jgi:hypothetical protein
MIASLRDYLPLSDLWKIVIACLVVAVVAPTAVSIAIVGLDRREHATAARQRETGGLLIVLGTGIIAALIAAGLYTLFTD